MSNTTFVSNEDELGQALKDKKSRIEVEINLAGKVIRIKATGKVAWAVAIGAIGVAVVAALAALPTGGTSAAAAPAALAAAAIAMGGPAALPVASTAVAIAVAAGGVGALNRLRKYKLTKLPNGRVLLER